MQLSMKAARVNAGLTQTDIATLCGVSRVSVKNWENGISVPRADSFIKFCNACDIDPKYIFLPCGLRKAEADEEK